jgi:RNA-binding protein
LSPAARLGKGGYSAAFVAEVERNLADHELIKVRIDAGERADFQALAARLAEQTGAALAQTIGRICLLYRPGAEPEIRLP